MQWRRLLVWSVLLISFRALDSRRVTAVSAGTSPAMLTPADLEAAIHRGESGSAAPYPLHHLRSGDSTSDVVVGAVYTPFVRIALAAKAAWDDGRHLLRDEIPTAMTEPVVYVAFRWYCCDPEHGATPDSFNPFATADYRIAVPGDWRFGRRSIPAAPLWVQSDLTVLGALGGAPYPDVVLVAAYPLSALAQPGDFIIYRPTTDPDSGAPGTSQELGHVTAIDVRTWR